MDTRLSIPAPVAPPVASCKAMIFRVADQWFALPATAILKILPASTFAAADIASEKLTLWHDQPLSWLNLHALLTRFSTAATVDKVPPVPPPFVLIVWSPTGDRCAIPVDELPTLQEIPLTQAQVLPPHHRQTIGGIARYLVILPHQAATLSLILLDLQQALNRS